MLTRSLIKTLKKIVLPSQSMIISFIVLLTIFVLSGGIYITFTNPFPPSAITIGQKAVFVIPLTLTRMLGVEQTSSETIVVMFFITLGTLGILMINRSATFMYDSRTARIWLVMGIILVLVSMLGLMFLNGIKRGF